MLLLSQAAIQFVTKVLELNCILESFALGEFRAADICSFLY